MTVEPRLVPPRREARAQGLGRWPVAFAPRFFLALIVGLVWLGPAWWNLRLGALMLVWDALVLLIWWGDLRRLPRPSEVTLAREWTEAVSLGRPCLVKLKVCATGKTAVLVTLEDEVPESVSARPARIEWVAPPGRSSEGSYSFEPTGRGDAHWGRVFARYRSALQFAERRVVADLAQTVRIYPDLETAKKMSLYLLRSRQIELEKRLQVHPGRGREFESLREYRQGDELRDICWTATARRARLVTRTYRPERSQTVFLVMDLGRLMMARSGSFTKLDDAVAAALSLAQVALAGGDSVGLIAYDRTIQARLNPSRGSSHLRLILEQLALARGVLTEADHSRAAEILLKSQRRRALVVWITDLAETAATPEVIESAMRLLPRHLVLFAVMGQPEFAALLSHSPETKDEMYRYAAAMELRSRREMLMRRLHERGALTLEASSGRLATVLVNSYLRVKEESLL